MQIQRSPTLVGACAKATNPMARASEALPHPLPLIRIQPIRYGSERIAEIARAPPRGQRRKDLTDPATPQAQGPSH